MATRTSSAIWEGNLKEGKGTMKVGAALMKARFSFASRFEDGGRNKSGELIGARSVVFRWRFRRICQGSHQQKSVHTIAKMNLEMIGGGPKSPPSILIAKAMFRESTMQNLGTGGTDEEDCPVSVALAGTENKAECAVKELT